jgi:NADPH-dependent curcumin reductase CurA
VWHACGWRDYAAVEAGRPALGGLGTLTKLDLDLALAQAYLGVLCGYGITAYAGLFHIAGLRGRHRVGLRCRGMRRESRRTDGQGSADTA